LLDEIELYYHPEMQRSYLAYLLKMLSRMEVSTLKSINICMVTHSPYILSDIPDNYLLRLEDGKASEKKEDKTFGANIHDLLANNFFMSSTTGEFAQIQIREIVNFYYRVKRYVEAQNDTNSSQNQNIAKIDSEKELKLIYEDKEERFRYVIKNMGEDVVKSILENHIKFIESKLGVENKQLKIERLNEEIRKRQEELLKLQGDD
jgi:predicted ATP-binding protein involved in virulence